MKIRSMLIATLCVAFNLAGLHATEDKKDAANTDIEVKVPDTAEALWAEIDTKYKQLAEAVNAAKPDAKQVTELAETVEALVKAVPDKTPGLVAEKKKRVEGQVKNVARVLDEMHDAISEGHPDVGVKKLTQVQAALKIIKDQVAK